MIFAPIAAFATTGCLAQTALDVVTLPVKVASAGVDLATTSQSEADEKRGRALRRHEERVGKLEREFFKLQGKCFKGDRRACERQVAVRAELDTVAWNGPPQDR